ncbi:hypothetical protein KEM56_000513 [Ascosphaera pollenicola]|nr:hypothetical protein KEM56_000513 [Ascosphaera pollenicola]
MAVNPRVLILGGHGKISLLLTPMLLQRSWDVVSVIRNPSQADEIKALGKGKAGKVEVLVSSLDDVRSDADAESIVKRANPDYVVWSAGAGGKGGPERTNLVDRDACKHIITASLNKPKVKKFLLVSHVGSRRLPPPWMSKENWAKIEHINTEVLPAYYAAKLEADEYFLATTKKRVDSGDSKFQSILLRPGLLTDDKASGKVDLGKASAGGNTSREQVAIVADKLLARDDTRGWIDLHDGDEPIDEAIDRVVRDKVDTVEGEDVEAVYKKYNVL